MKVLGIALVLTFLRLAMAAETNVIERGSLENSRIQFQTQKKGHVAFLGGSITEMEGYRPMVCELLQKRFPETAFTFTNAGIGSTCSTTGAFRLQEDVLSKGPVDLFFVEFAVNDDQDAHHSHAECIRGMEGIVRHVHRYNPNADIVITYFVNEHYLAQYHKGETPLPIAAHEEVAAHYQIPSIHLAREVATRIDAGEFDWKKFGGVHPAPFGNRIAADMIGTLLEKCWKAPLASGATPKAHSLPEQPLDAANYGFGKFVDSKDLKLAAPFQVHVPDWAGLPGGKRDRFTRIPMIEATTPGASLSLDFNGTAIGAFVVAGPDAGTVEVSIDGGPAVKKTLYHDFSGGLHYPRTVLFADALAPQKHSMVLKISEEKDPRSKGNAMRAIHFVVNEPE